MRYIVQVSALAALIAVGGISGAMAKPGGPQMSFEELDTNSDGKITQEEMQARGAARFAQTDADGDGALSLEELQSAMQKKSEQRAAKMMEHLDADGDGKITQDEMKVGLDGKRGGDRFARADTDGDGALRKAEFEEAQKHRGKHGKKGKRHNKPVTE